jgi:hypothetical protein
MLGYLTTFFSFFGTLLLLTVLVSNMVNLFNVNKLLKKIVSVGMVIFFFTCSVLTDFSNYSIAKDIRSANLRFYAIDELVKTDEFKSIPAWTPFYARTLWDNPSESAPMLTEQDFNWYLYFEARTGTTYPFAREDKFFLDYCKKKELDPWMIVSRQAVTSDDLMLVLAKMKRVQPQDTVVDRFADRAMVLYYSPYKVFTISFRLKNEQGMTRIPVSFNTVTDTLRVGTEVEMTVFCTRKDHKATHFILEAPGIDLTSINISNMVNPANYTFYLAQPKD